MEMPTILSNSGWIAIPLLLISIANLALFISTYSLIRNTNKSLKMDDLKYMNFLNHENNFTQDQERQNNPVNNSSLKDSYLDTWELFTVPILRNSSWISNLASIATLLGLLGTVLGIQESFTAMQALGKTTLDIFAGGVSRALSTTILGLCIAIPSYLLNQLLKSELLQLTALFQIKLAKNLESDSKNQ